MYLCTAIVLPYTNLLTCTNVLINLTWLSIFVSFRPIGSCAQSNSRAACYMLRRYNLIFKYHNLALLRLKLITLEWLSIEFPLWIWRIRIQKATRYVSGPTRLSCRLEREREEACIQVPRLPAKCETCAVSIGIYIILFFLLTTVDQADFNLVLLLNETLWCHAVMWLN